MFRIFFVFIVFITTSYAKTIFIEGIDNKFMCDGKQSSGGGFQKCGKITALKPMTLCFSSPSGMKCKKLEPNETLDTEVDTNFADNKNDDEEKKKNTTVKNDTPRPTKNNAPFDFKPLDLTKEQIETSSLAVNNISEQTITNASNSVALPNLAKLFNLNTTIYTDNGTSPNIIGYSPPASQDGYKIVTDNLTYAFSSEKSLTLNDNFEYDFTDNPLMEASSSWGYWNDTYFGAPEANGVQIQGLKTSTSVISDILNNSYSRTYNFYGGVLGAVLTSSNNIEDILTDSTNSLQMTFDLGGGVNNMTGTMAFKSTSTSWDVNLSSSHAQISNSGFTGDITSGDTIVTSGSLEGKFFGESKIKSIGGKFDITSSNGDKAGGVFRAIK